MNKLKYLAYGSNLHLARMQIRVPTAEAVETHELCGWSLHFHKRGRDGSAKCNVINTNDPRDRVHGVIYEIEAHEKKHLDKAEGLGKGYEIHRLELEQLGPVFLYLASADYIDDSLHPFSWYKAFVVQGAQQQGLPEAYIRKLARVEAVRDPDSCRHQRNIRIIERAIRYIFQQ